MHIVRMPELFCTIFCPSSLHQAQSFLLFRQTVDDLCLPVFQYTAAVDFIRQLSPPDQWRRQDFSLGGAYRGTEGVGCWERAWTKPDSACSESVGEFAGRVCRHLAIPADTPTDSEHAECGGVNVVPTTLQCFAFPTKPCSAPFWST